MRERIRQAFLSIVAMTALAAWSLFFPYHVTSIRDLSCLPLASSHSLPKWRRIPSSRLQVCYCEHSVSMGVEPPFIYDHPSRYSFNGPTDRGFNPKAATQASWVPPVSKPKQDGPLVNFNKHPDSVRVSRLNCVPPTNAIAVPDCAVWQP